MAGRQRRPFGILGWRLKIQRGQARTKTATPFYDSPTGYTYRDRDYVPRYPLGTHSLDCHILDLGPFNFFRHNVLRGSNVARTRER